MQIKWLRKALTNLDDEAKYIAQEDPQAARLVVHRVVQAVSLLSDNPALGHPGRVPGTHELVIPKTRYIDSQDPLYCPLSGPPSPATYRDSSGLSHLT
jgi:toxin ParE1/3/4